MKTLTKKRLAGVWIVGAWMAAGGALGAEITLEQAERAVGNWAVRGGAFGTLSGEPEVSGETFEDSDTGAKMHVVRVPGRGFAVTSADDGIEPIILFSDGDGEFAAEAGNPLWDLLRWDLAARGKALAEGSGTGHAGMVRKGDTGGTDGATAQEKWAELLSEPEGPQKRGNGYYGLVKEGLHIRRWPLLKTSWNQTEGAYGGIYNMYTPGKIEVTTVHVARAAAAARAPTGWVADMLVTNETGHYPVGCVAVAGGQVMNFWQYPTSAVPARTVACQVDDESRALTFHGTFVGDDGFRYGSYMWDWMGVDEPVLTVENERVSRLLSDIGVGCAAHYTESGTSMAISRLASLLKSTYGYANAVYHTANLTGSGLRQVLIPNLDAGAPVVLGIGQAHAVVADGYAFNADETTFYVHINLGWGQSVHLWYVPPEIDRYSSIDEILCNVFPDFTGVVLSGRVTGPHNRPVYKMNMVRSGTTHGATETGRDGIYHFLLGAGNYQVTPLAMDGTAAAAAKSVSLDAMSRTVNGNRILDFQATNVLTVGDIAVGTATPRTAKGPSTTFSEPFSVTLSCPTAGGEIHYTLDDRIPGADDPVYDGPITIYDTATLRAVAFADGMECSEMLEADYTFEDLVSRDNFADARPISGASGRSSFDNAGYTREIGEPYYHSSEEVYSESSAWAVWSAPESGDWTFYLSGKRHDNDGPMDTQMAVYTGDTVSNLVQVAANEDVDANGGDYSSRVSFHAEKGQVYHIAMDSYNVQDYPGTLLLRWEEGYVHYVQASYSPQWLPVSGGRQEMEINATTNWHVVDCSEWIAPIHASGDAGTPLVYNVSPNGTGTERTGFVTLQAGNSPQVSFLIRQHSLDFVTTQEAAVDAAWRDNKRILLIYGREGCPNTRATMFSSMPAVRDLLEAGFVLWYSNCDRQLDASIYSQGNTLPTVAILDPLDMGACVAGRSGYQSASSLRSFLQSCPSWPGLPQAKIDLRGDNTATAVQATVKVRSWGAEAASALVTLETAMEAAFSTVTSTRPLGTVTQIWTARDWTFDIPQEPETAFLRVRVESGDWSAVSDVFVPLGVALDNATLDFALEGGDPWQGQTKVSHDGVAAAQCTGETAGGTNFWVKSSLNTVVTGPGRLSFWWKGTGSYGYLVLNVDGLMKNSLSVTSKDWNAVSWDCNNTNSHEVAWVLERCNDRNPYYNVSGWVDQVVWKPGSIIRLDHQNEVTGQELLALRGEEMPAANVPSKMYHVFGGFFSETNGMGVQYYDKDGVGLRNWDQTGVATLYAKWTPYTYAVTLDRQGGTGGTESVVATYGEFPPAVEIPTRPGYDFGGYYSGKNGTGTQYYKASGRGTQPWPHTWDITLYALWYEQAEVDWSYRISNGKAFVTKATPAAGRLSIPGKLGGCPVAGIDASAFRDCVDLRAVVLPSGVKSIGNSAFSGCRNLAEVFLPDTLETIGEHAFGGCSSLEFLELPESLRNIGQYAFYGFDGLMSIGIPDSVTNIGPYAFYNCTNLTSVAIPDSVTRIGSSAFGACYGLRDVSIGSNVTNIESSAFYYCTNLTSVVVPDSVKDVGNYAFGYCFGLTTVTLSRNLTRIANGMFSFCTQLGSVIIPDGVTNIGASAFGHCRYLSSLTLPRTVTSIGDGAFNDCVSLASMSIPDSVDDIGSDVFPSCLRLARLEVPGAWYGSDRLDRTAVPWECHVIYRGVEPLAVETLELEDGQAERGYGALLEASGGIAPYKWSWSEAEQYAELTVPGSYEEAGWDMGWKQENGCWNLELPFAFPFFGQAYTNAKVNVNGTISFGNSNFTNRLYSAEAFYGTPLIAVLWHNLASVGAKGYGIYVDSGPDAVTVEWRGRYYLYVIPTYEYKAVNFSVTLRKDGTIVLKYGSGNENGGTIGISAGDGQTAMLSGKSCRGSMANADDIVFRPNPVGSLPPGMSLIPDGSLQGTPTAVGEYVFTVVAADSTGVTATRTLTLQVKAASQRVTFDAAGGTCGTAAKTYATGKAYGTLPTPKWAGHAWLGWFDEAEGGTQVTADSIVPAVAERTLYAHWTDTQRVTLDARGGTCSTSGKIATVGAKYGTLPRPTMANHAFLGWFTAVEGGSQVTANSTVTTAAERTLYAHWTSEQTLTLDAGGGAVAQEIIVAAIGGEYGTLPSPKWSGHVFLGWFTQAGGGSQVTAADQVTVAAARTLYAHWTDRQVTTFLGNGGKPSAQATTNKIYADYGTFPEAKWSGHALVGWFTAPEGGKRVYTNSTVTLAATRTLYAQWTTEQVTTFKANGGSPATRKTTNTIYAAYGAFPEVKWSGHALVGWFTAQEGGKRIYTNSTVTLSATRTLYAQWTTNQVTTFKGNGGTPEIQKTTNAIYTHYGTLPEAVWENHAFLGWFNHPTKGKRVYTNSTVTLAATRSLYAHWTDQQVTTFKGNGGTPKTQATTNTMGAAYGTMPTPKKSGYAFLGWFTKADGGDEVTAVDLVTVATSRTLYAHWSDQQVTTFLGNGGMPATQATTNTIYAQYIAMPTPKWSGHVFLGWFSAQEGGKRVYTNSTVTLAATRTLYAHWTDQQVTTFQGNGGTPDTQATTNTIYAKYGMMPAATWEGHVFQGWFTAKEGGKRVYTNSTVTLAVSRTLYAHWTTAKGFAITAIAVGADGGDDKPAPRAVRDTENEKSENVCRLRFELSEGMEYEIQWTAALDVEWETVERLRADTDGEVEIAIEVPGGEKGFFRLVVSGDVGEVD